MNPHLPYLFGVIESVLGYLTPGISSGKIPLPEIEGKQLINNIKHLPTGRGSTYATPFTRLEGGHSRILKKTFL